MAITGFDVATQTDIVGSAMAFCAEKAGLWSKEEVAERLHLADCTACAYLRYGLARAVAEYLGSVDGTVKVIYNYDPERATAIDGDIDSTGINLIVWADRKSAALSSLVGLISRALAEECGKLGCPKADALCCTLDIQVVDDEEVRYRSGYGALINSLYVRPQEVWRR